MSIGLSRLDLVANIRFPGRRANSIQVAYMAEALSATGLTVDVVVPRRYPYREIDAFEYYGVRRTFRVQRIASLDTIDLVPPRLQRVPFLLQSVTFGWRALARVAIERDAGVLARDHYTLDVLVRGLRDGDRGRVAAEIHNLPSHAERRARLVRHLATLPAVVTISEALREDLVADGLSADCVLTAHDGVELRRFDGLHDAPTARRELGIPVDVPTVVYTGQLYPWKGVDTLVLAMARCPDAQLLVVGGFGPDLLRVRALAERVAPGRVVFTGTVPHGHVPFYLSAADVVAIPNSGTETISARYTSPLKLFEAMASRRPVLASDLPSLREILTHDANALLVAPDEPEALADGLRALLGDPVRARRLAQRAADDVEAYDWAARGRRVATFLRQRLRVAG